MTPRGEFPLLEEKEKVDWGRTGRRDWEERMLEVSGKQIMPYSWSHMGGVLGRGNRGNLWEREERREAGRKPRLFFFF